MTKPLTPQAGLSTCSISDHNTLGPIVDDDCYNGLDFTLLFEEAFMSIVPACMGMVWIVACIWYLRNQPVIVARGWLYGTKMVRCTSSNQTFSTDLTI
jgi:hypothetical protein